MLAALVLTPKDHGKTTCVNRSLTMEGFDNFICSISNTHVANSALDEKGLIDYAKLNLVLFEMPTYSYLEMGPIIGKCMKMH